MPFISLTSLNKLLNLFCLSFLCYKTRREIALQRYRKAKLIFAKRFEPSSWRCLHLALSYSISSWDALLVVLVAWINIVKCARGQPVQSGVINNGSNESIKVVCFTETCRLFHPNLILFVLLQKCLKISKKQLALQSLVQLLTLCLLPAAWKWGPLARI